MIAVVNYSHRAVRAVPVTYSARSWGLAAFLPISPTPAVAATSLFPYLVSQLQQQRIKRKKKNQLCCILFPLGG